MADLFNIKFDSGNQQQLEQQLGYALPTSGIDTSTQSKILRDYQNTQAVKSGQGLQFSFTPYQGVPQQAPITAPQITSNPQGGINYSVPDSYYQNLQNQIASSQKITEDNALRVQQAIMAQQKAMQDAQNVSSKYNIDQLRQQQLQTAQRGQALQQQASQTLLGIQNNPELTMAQIVGSQGQARQVLGSQLEGIQGQAQVEQVNYENALNAMNQERNMLLQNAQSQLDAASQMYNLSDKQYQNLANQLNQEIERQYNINLNNIRLQQEQAQLKQAEAKLTTDSELNKLLSPSEAKALGVPYGTTKGQAAQLGITPTTTRGGGGVTYTPSQENINYLGAPVQTREYKNQTQAKNDIRAEIDKVYRTYITSGMKPEVAKVGISGNVKKSLYGLYPYLDRGVIDGIVNAKIKELFPESKGSTKSERSA